MAFAVRKYFNCRGCTGGYAFQFFGRARGVYLGIFGKIDSFCRIHFNNLSAVSGKIFRVPIVFNASVRVFTDFYPGPREISAVPHKVPFAKARGPFQASPRQNHHIWIFLRLGEYRSIASSKKKSYRGCT